jgi:3-deoxy-manno-octulosonate cytidylyltransferase (CMP-KDO synthetase)
VAKDYEYSLHLGLQCYDSKFLAVYPKLPDTPLQLQEDLEQLKVAPNAQHTLQLHPEA